MLFSLQNWFIESKKTVPIKISHPHSLAIRAPWSPLSSSYSTTSRKVVLPQDFIFENKDFISEIGSGFSLNPQYSALECLHDSKISLAFSTV